MKKIYQRPAIQVFSVDTMSTLLSSFTGLNTNGLDGVTSQEWDKDDSPSSFVKGTGQGDWDEIWDENNW